MPAPEFGEMTNPTNFFLGLFVQLAILHFPAICGIIIVSRGEGNRNPVDKGGTEILIKSSKPLDKSIKVCYNVDTTKRKELIPMVKTIKLFERELALIKNEELRTATAGYLETYVPNYFWMDGASASGKYHPKFSHGEGGLVRHTKAVVMFAEELLRMSSYSFMNEEYKDYVICACIVHDTVKYGFTDELDKTEYANHAHNASVLFTEYCENEMGFTPHFLLTQAIRSHMGQWSTNKDDKPFTSVDRCVHMADYMASRSFIDIPTLTAEWEAERLACELCVQMADIEDTEGENRKGE